MRVDELVLGVSVNLGKALIDRCLALDADFDHRMVVAELVRGVRHSLEGCVSR